MDYKRLITAWWLPAAILVTALLPVLADESLVALRYDRAAIAGGELWRLLSGHWVHLGTEHFVLNAAGLLLVWYLTGAVFSALQWLFVMAASLVAMDTGFWLLMPELAWYVGLSGLLHGMLAAGTAGLWHRQRGEAMVLAAILIAKLGYELLVGPLPGSADTAGGAVITEAHLFGAVGGLLAGFLIMRRVRPLTPI